jgi:hypothetical protein
MIEIIPQSYFKKGDLVKVITDKPGSPYFGIVLKQEHQWLYTSVGIFNTGLDEVKTYLIRKV